MRCGVQGCGYRAEKKYPGISIHRMRCTIYGCKSRSARKIPGISIHAFPRDEHMLHLWKQAVGEQFKKHSGVCSKHFLESDFIRVSCRAFLKRDAVPSRNLFMEPYNPRGKTNVTSTPSNAENVESSTIPEKDDRMLVEMAKHSNTFIEVEEDEAFIKKIFSHTERGDDDISLIETLSASSVDTTRPADMHPSPTIDAKVDEMENWKCGEILSLGRGGLILVCIICTEKFDTLESFGEHLEQSHQKRKHENYPENNSAVIDEYENNQQNNVEEDVEFIDKSKLIINKSNPVIKKKQDVRDEESKIFCETCNKWFKSHETMDKHLNSCRTTFKVNQLTTRNEQQNNKEYIDNSTNNSNTSSNLFATDNLITREVNSSEINYEENIQQFETPILEKMTQSETIYQCKYCDCTFQNDNSRIEHECLHTGIKPFKCGICGKSFRTRANLYLHKNSHCR